MMQVYKNQNVKNSMHFIFEFETKLIQKYGVLICLNKFIVDRKIFVARKKFLSSSIFAFRFFSHLKITLNLIF